MYHTITFLGVLDIMCLPKKVLDVIYSYWKKQSLILFSHMGISLEYKVFQQEAGLEMLYPHGKKPEIAHTLAEAMLSPLGTSHICLVNGVPYGKALFRIPPTWKGPIDLMLQTPALILAHCGELRCAGPEDGAGFRLPPSRG